MARRFTDQHCVLLDDGTVLGELEGGGLPRGARILGIDGAVHELGATAKASGDQQGAHDVMDGRGAGS